MKLGTRMTVVRIGDGLVIHSPVALGAALRAEIEALGAVRHVVAPNLYHHVYAAEHQRAWPEAILHAPAALAKKRRDLRVDRVLGAPPASGQGDPWEGALVPHAIEGSMLEETVLLHPASRTLISSDLIENFQRMDDTPTRLYLQAGGVWKKPGWSRLLRPVYRDRRAARRSLDALLEREWDRLILAHGDPLEASAKDAVRSGMDWLRG